MSCTKEGYQYDNTGIHRGLRTDAVVPSTLNTKSSYDVIVIGSGFCGLVAARNLALDRNLRVLLLEARDRIGGRTWTAKAWGEEFEMGGTFVHWHQPHFYAEMHRHGLEKHIKMSAGTTATDTILYKPRGLDVMGLDVAEYNPRIARIAEMFFSIDGMTPREVMPYPHEPSRPQPWQRYDLMSCQDRLDQLDISQEDKDQFVCHTNSFGSSAARDIAWPDALRWYALGGYSLQTMYDAVGCFKLGNGGMTNFARHILEEYNGDRIFNKAVTAIKEAKNAEITVSCADGSDYRARRVVCTIPLNCLSDVQFDPPLSPAKQSAAHAGHTNLGEKYHFVLNETQGNWFANTSDPQSSFLFGMKDHDGTQSANRSGSIAMMFGHSGKLTDPTKSEHIINEFKKLQPSGDVRGYLSHTWSEDLYAKGAWFCAFPGQATKSLKALQEPHGRVFMASADWAQGWRGFIDGAIEQGARASAIVKFALEQEDCISTPKL
ncbi:FAD/NAD(P)-binding domain-containing protein, partial [Aureobasidium melanogenum]